MTLTLYGHPASTYTLIIIYVLKELGLSYEFVLKSSDEIKSPEYLATMQPL
jgi:glutathione S-transferase